MIHSKSKDNINEIKLNSQGNNLRKIKSNIGSLHSIKLSSTPKGKTLALETLKNKSKAVLDKDQTKIIRDF